MADLIVLPQVYNANRLAAIIIIMYIVAIIIIILTL